MFSSQNSVTKQAVSHNDLKKWPERGRNESRQLSSWTVSGSGRWATINFLQPAKLDSAAIYSALCHDVASVFVTSQKHCKYQHFKALRLKTS